jgi:catechol 2,3-dioxygenase-like lactoylglutathione lyase family enzyme
MSINRIHHVQITVVPEDTDRARHFYCNLLGLTEVEKPEALKPRGGFWMQLGDQQIHVGVEPKEGQTKAHVAYQVDDLAAWRAKLRAAGVEIGTSVAIPGFERFEFRDPFGNRVEFIQLD